MWKINSGLVWAAGPYLWVWGRLWATFEGVFNVFKGKKKNWKYHSLRTEKLHRKKVIFFSCFCLFYRLKFECKYMKVGNKHLFSYLCGAESYFYETELLEIWASFGLACSTANFCNFSKVTYFWGCFLPLLTTKTNTKLECMYIVLSALKIWWT